MRWFLTSSLLLLTFLAVRPAAAQTHEELYGDYITPETRAILERHEQAIQEAEAAQEAARARKTLILAVAGLIGLIPVVVIGRRVLREKTWKDNPGGTARALVAALAGGIVLFGLNYGVLYLKLKYGEAFNTALAFLIVAGLIVGCIYMLRGK